MWKGRRSSIRSAKLSPVPDILPCISATVITAIIRQRHPPNNTKLCNPLLRTRFFLPGVCSRDPETVRGELSIPLWCDFNFDNAPMESFWGILKQELINHRHYSIRREAIEEITKYIEIFYNRQWLQAKLGFLSPVAYVQKYYVGLVAA